MKTGKRLWGFLNLHFAVALLLGLVSHTPTAIAQSTGTFTPTGNMTTARIGHTATLLNNGKVLIAGGTLIEGKAGTPPIFKTQSSSELYDPGTGTFTATGNMTTARSDHTATLLPDGKVLISGGGVNIGGVTVAVLASAELYDPDTGTFSATGDMTTARFGHKATLLNNGKVLIAGVTGASAELYDPCTGTFTATGDMTSERAVTATLLPNGKVLIYRGTLDDPLFSAELYDPSTGTFAGTGNTTVNHSGPTATLLANGKVLIAGGDWGDGDGGSWRAEIYDAATGTFTDTGNMAIGREQHAATILPDGTVLFAGGHLRDTDKDSAELYDPVTGTFHSTGKMATGRELHTATLLNDGRVLITGGDDERYWVPETILSSAELYTPPMLVPAPVLLSIPGDGQGQGAILHSETHQVVSISNPAIVGEALEIYLTGLGDGSVIPPQVSIGGRMADILFFGKSPGFAGLNQVNVRVPSSVAPGPAVPVRLTYLGRPSNEVTIAVR